MDISIELLSLLFMVAILAGFVDAVAGGGGLLTVPSLLLAGLSPVSALATNKLQGSAGTFSASITMIKKGIADPKQMKIALLMAFIGSAIATIIVQISPPDMLKNLIPVVIAIIGLYTLFAPNLGEVQRKARISEKMWQRLFVPIIGFYDGYLGPGTGTFFSLGGVALRGMDLVKSTGAAKLLNFATNIASLIFFVIGGQIVWLIGLVMICGQIIGAAIGSQLVITKGVKFIKPMIVLMCFAMVIRYVFW